MLEDTADLEGEGTGVEVGRGEQEEEPSKEGEGRMDEVKQRRTRIPKRIWAWKG